MNFVRYISVPTHLGIPTGEIMREIIYVLMQK